MAFGIYVSNENYRSTNFTGRSLGIPDIRSLILKNVLKSISPIWRLKCRNPYFDKRAYLCSPKASINSLGMVKAMTN